MINSAQPTPTSAVEKAYVLGTHDEEITRLGLQHRVWRPYMLAAWQTAGIWQGHTVLDVGCGPGYACMDLGEVVGPSGRVIAIDKSHRFLHALDNMRRTRGLDNIEIAQADLDGGEFPSIAADFAWCRWVFAFVRHPREILMRMASALKPGGVVILHEYFDYATWRSMPRCAELDSFVAAVMKSWRDAGGEPDVALSLPSWLQEIGFVIKTIRPIIHVTQRNEMIWSWLGTFLQVGCQRLLDLGYLNTSQAESIRRAFSEFEARHDSRMITPGVLEIIATRQVLSGVVST